MLRSRPLEMPCQPSAALFGFGVDSFVEVGAAAIVLWRLRGETGGGALMSRDRERLGTGIVGGLLLLLGVGVAVGGALQLWLGAQPDSFVPGLVISGVSIALMVLLWRAKRRVATALDSRTLMADAACTRSCVGAGAGQPRRPGRAAHR